ncbi:hypothetical protein RCL1_005777 [Eukaryota sp. TZLM3-RCL]
MSSSDEEFYDSDTPVPPPTKKLRLTRGAKSASKTVPQITSPSPVSEYPPSGYACVLPWKNPNWNSGKKKRSFRTLKQIFVAENIDALPPSIPTIKSIEASPSLLPKTHYCDLTGLPAPYTDPSSGLYYHNAQVFQYIQTLSVSQIQAFKRIRKVEIIK